MTRRARRSRQAILRKLNEVYADGMTAEENRILKGMKAKFAAMIIERW